MGQTSAPARAAAVPRGRRRGVARRADWLWGGLIVLLVLLAYAPSLSGGYIWDDNRNVTQNANLEDLPGLLRIWTDPRAVQHYYPLTHTSFWIEQQVFGPGPFWRRLDNVLLHALAAMLLWRALLRLAVPGAWLAAAVFALHPVNVESVAWITERKNVLEKSPHRPRQTAEKGGQSASMFPVAKSPVKAERCRHRCNLHRSPRRRGLSNRCALRVG